MTFGLREYVIAFLAITLLAVAAFAYAEHEKIIGLESSNTALTTERDVANDGNTQLKAANGQYETATRQLANDLDACVGKKQAVDKILATTQATLAKVQRQRAAALRELNQTKEKIYANDPACSAWGAAPVCGGISDGLRQQWQQAQRAIDGVSTDSGAGSAPAAHADSGQHDGAAGPAGPPAG